MQIYEQLELSEPIEVLSINSKDDPEINEPTLLDDLKLPIQKVIYKKIIQKKLIF